MTYPTFDFRRGITWGDMLGNDVYGDCFEAAFENLRILKAVSSLSPLGKALYELGWRRPHTRYTESLYFDWGIWAGEQGPKPDQGTSMPSFGQWAASKGLLIACASVDVTPTIIDGADFETRMREAAIAFHGGIIEANLPSTVNQQFASHQPFDIPAGTTPKFIGAHAMTYARANENDDVFVTWNQTKAATLNWVEQCRFGFWVFLTKEDQARKGYDFAGALAKIRTMNDAIVAPGF